MHRVVTRKFHCLQLGTMAQVATGFIKANQVKHISPTFFGYMQDLVETSEVKVTKIECAKNISDMLTKALPAYRHRELVHAAEMQTLQELSTWPIERTFFAPRPKHIDHISLLGVFNEVLID